MDTSPFTSDEQVSTCLALSSSLQDLLSVLTYRFVQRFVLAEIVKVSTVEIDALMAFIRSKDISPDWMHMQLPRGTNASSRSSLDIAY